MADRGASVRIPWQVEIDQKGYIEDRRPNANMDPYVVTRLITETVCSALEDCEQLTDVGGGRAMCTAVRPPLRTVERQER